jgi:hypothetical protein
MAEYFYGKHQRGQPPDWSGEVFQVAEDTVPANALIMVIDPGGNRTAQGDDRHASWGFEAGDQSDEVRDQDEESQGDQIGHVGLVVVADDLIAHVADESFNTLDHVLQGAGRIHGKAHAGSQEEQQQE